MRRAKEGREKQEGNFKNPVITKSIFDFSKCFGKS